MTPDTNTPFLYLTTTGRKTGVPHQIEIWFVAYDGAYYLCSEGRDQADWARNIAADPRVEVQIGSRDAARVEAHGRWVDDAAEHDLTMALHALFNAKYSWSDGLFVELRPV